jgi:hypothetical protein
VHAPTDNKDDDMKDRFYEELEEVFDQFPMLHMKILMGDSIANVEGEEFFKPIIGNESQHEASNDIGVRVVNFTTPKNLIIKGKRFPHSDIHKHTWTSLMVSHIIR